MPLTTFTPNTKAKSSEVNANFEGLADGTLISDGAILPNHLLASASSNNDYSWDTYTPTLTNITVGNGTQTGYYMKLGKTVFFRGSFVFGSSSSMGSAPRVSLPITASSNIPNTSAPTPIGAAWYEDAGSAAYAPGILVMNGVSGLTSAQFIIENVGSTYPTATGLTSTIPFSWGNTDFLAWQGFYEAA